MDLKDFGWEETSFPAAPREKPFCVPARVVEEQKGGYYVAAAAGELWAEVAGRLQYESGSRMELPVVGDWVWIHPAEPGQLSLIHGILPRRNCLARVGAGRDQSLGEEQPLAANLDAVLIVTSLNQEFNASRLERYGSLAWHCGIRPVVLLTKADLCGDIGPFVAEATAALPGVEVLAISALTGAGMERLSATLRPGSTTALVGSSGVGKSTLVNRLMGRAVRETLEVSAEGDRGRHATTNRSLFRLPSGALLVDTPGLREVAFSRADGEGLGRTFADIERLAAACRFRDCTHDQEPGCAVRKAMESGTLPERRYRSYRKLLREQTFLRTKTDPSAAHQRKENQKKISRFIKDLFKEKP